MLSKSGSIVSLQNFRGMVWMAIYTVLISGMHICIRSISEEGIHPYQIAFFRNLFALFIIIPWFVKYGAAPLKTARIKLLFLRGTINSISMLAFFLGLSLIPVAEVAALSFSAPIYATLIGMVMFREQVGVLRWCAIFAGFVGVLIILKPGFGSIGFGQILVILSAFGWGICIVLVKEIGRTDSAITITAYMSIIMAPLTLPAAIYYWIWPSLEQIAWLFVVGMLGGLGQLAMSKSLRLAETHVVAPVDFLRLIIVSIFGYLIFNEIPDHFVWIGGAMILGSVTFIAYREHLKKNEFTQFQ